MTLIDTHCHINFDAYDEDRPQVIERAAQARVTRILNPGVDLDSSRAVLKLAVEYPALYAAVGVHPNSASNFSEADLDSLRHLATGEKVLAIGEIGLDYYRDRTSPQQQRRAFEAQLGLAAELDVPVIIHNREAGSDVLDVLEAWIPTLSDSLRDRPGVLHSFSAPAEIAERALATGLYLGFTGPITFKKADDLRQIARTVPLDRILVETDGPFLTPVPYRGKRNEPAYIPHIVTALAALKQIPDDEMGRHTTDNALRLFRFDQPS